MDGYELATLALVGALDSKGEEYALASRLARERGLRTVLVDVGIRGTPTIKADIGREVVSAAAGSTVAELRALPERSAGLALMADGLCAVLGDLYRTGGLDAAFAMGGSGALALCAPAFRALPLGVPKVIASTMAASDMSTVIGASDLVVLPTVVDIAGLNRFSRFAIERAVATVAAMLGVRVSDDRSRTASVGLTMLGVTTTGVTAIRGRLADAGYDTTIFHANGAGGRSLEALTAGGWLDAVVDVTTGELASELVGGISAAGSDRLTAAAAKGIPQVVSIGGCDFAIFGALDRVPPAFRDRTLYQHSPTATLMRTRVEECERIGAEIVAKLAAARGPARVLLPTSGLSELSAPGGPFHDPAADGALREVVRSGLPGSIECVDVPGSINDDAFVDEATSSILALLTARFPRESHTRRESDSPHGR